MAGGSDVRREGRAAFVVATLIAAALLLGGAFALLWGATDDHHSAIIAIVESNGSPVVARARCGEPLPLKTVTIRVAPGNGSKPTGSDPIVFRATAIGNGHAEVPLVQAIDGYTVEWRGPLETGSRYYVDETRYISGSGDGVSTFTLDELSPAQMLLLYPLPGADEPHTVDPADWLSSTAC